MRLERGPPETSHTKPYVQTFQNVFTAGHATPAIQPTIQEYLEEQSPISVYDDELLPKKKKIRVK
jgi:hypothetical protein